MFGSGEGVTFEYLLCKICFSNSNNETIYLLENRNGMEERNKFEDPLIYLTTSV